tara:strand:+ start:452 stop:757 length:306 start_codon:yes stop_codon:yes gene_type:complete
MLYESSKMNTVEVVTDEMNVSDFFNESNGFAKARLNNAIAKHLTSNNTSLLGRDFFMERFFDFESRKTAENGICFFCFWVNRWIRIGMLIPNSPNKNKGEE